MLVTTPEKLNLMLRGGWEERIGRPLTLVVVDEAHNLAQPSRGLALELLLATINRECRYSQFLLLTPFIDNVGEIAQWLSPDNYSQIGLQVDWLPNDRAILLSSPVAAGRRGGFQISLDALHTSRKTLSVPEKITLDPYRPLGLTHSEVAHSPGKLAAATAQLMKQRGPVIVLAGQVRHAWSIASYLATPENILPDPHADVRLAKRFLEAEFGSDFLLTDLLGSGIGVHHSGLSDEARGLMEWLFEAGRLEILVATTTIAQGVNFPVSGVVFASHQYPYGQDMPPEDFWNIAGRAGRVDQGAIGLIVLAAPDNERRYLLTQFIGRAVSSLNSTLVAMVQNAMAEWGKLDLHALYVEPQWSSFLQYIAHTYRQVSNHEQFALEIEQVLRGTLGFAALRRSHPEWASGLVSAVHEYASTISGKPLSLVDLTGFSWESVSATLARLSEEQLTFKSWDPDRLFQEGNPDLRRMMGIMLKVPELRRNLLEAAGHRSLAGDRLARIISDWVGGASLHEIATAHFAVDDNGKPLSSTDALTECCQKVYGRLAQTASWGLSALQSLTFKGDIDALPDADRERLRNLPSKVYYGVNSDSAVALRLLGVPRSAATPLSETISIDPTRSPLSSVRAELGSAGPSLWQEAMGALGPDYYAVWNILQGNTPNPD